MLVNNENLTTIWYDKKLDVVKIIDQRLLPYKLKVVDINTISEICFAIKEMQVRGAPLIGITAAFGMYVAARKNSTFKFLENSAKEFKLTRPTAINLSWAVDKILTKISLIPESERSSHILKLALQMRLDDINTCELIGENGLKLIEEIYKKKNSTINILTHCNAGWLATVDWGTALSPIFKAKRKNIPIHVWVDETRPRNQGFNLTAWELMNEEIPNSLIVDNAGGHLMQNNQVDLCITGTDRTSLNGDVCNKIGTYLKALAAKDNNIPFYVAAPLSSIDLNITNGVKNIPIEERDSEEVSHIQGINKDGLIDRIEIVPKGAICKNFAFDVTPAKYVTMLITEKGNIKADTASISEIKN
jgi:methylthioribose-1-phosphate isomerase